ncbi:DUF721 domain-containing protein [Mariprofundus ferrooxydans]|nr:DUF721 domain-containing protein [Mariprofundus ferrooxydans]
MNRRNKRSRAKLAGIHDNLAKILGEESLNQLITLARLRRAWPHIVGAMMATRTEPIQLQGIENDGLCLWIGVDHSIMSQQIHFLRDDIRKACFKQTGINNLHKISTRMMPGSGIKAPPPPAQARRVHFHEKRRLALDVASIKDRSLRKAAFNAHLAQLAYDDAQSIETNNKTKEKQ